MRERTGELALRWVTATTLVAACSDGTGPGQDQAISLSVAVSASGPATQNTDSVQLGGHTLVFDKVELVLKKIELQRKGVDDCDEDQGGANESDGDNNDGSQNDDCEELELGPLLVDLPLTGKPERVLTVAADTGTFDKVKFKVHKPDDEDGDATFLRDHPEFQGISIRVRGRYDGKAFVYTSDLGAEQEYRLVPPLVVAAQTNANVTLVVSLESWFVLGGQLVNPELGLKGQPLESQIKDNVKRSFKAFEDDDRDGEDDDND